MAICKRCGKRGALENGICPQCLRKDRFTHGSLPLPDFKEKFIKDPVSGIFYADDACFNTNLTRRIGDSLR